MIRCIIIPGGFEAEFSAFIDAGGRLKNMTGKAISLMALYSLDVFDSESVLLKTFLLANHGKIF